MPITGALEKPYPGLDDPGEFPRPLFFYANIARLHLVKICFLCIALTALVLLGCALVPPIYNATAVIAVDWQAAPDTMRIRALLGAEEEEFMTTQEALLQAETILRPIAERYALLERERQLRHYWFWHYSATKEQAIRDGLVQLKHLKIDHVPRTYLLTITYCDRDPQIAADVANAIANSYLRNISEARNKEAGSFNSSIGQELNELDEHLKLIELGVMPPQRVTGTAEPEERASVALVQPQRPGTQVKSARADRLPEEAVYRKPGYGKVPEFGKSDRWGDLIGNIELSLVKPNHALVAGADEEPEGRLKVAQVNNSDTSPKDSHRNVSARRSIEYRQSSESESTISSAARETSQQADDLNSHPFDYLQLTHEVEAAERVNENISAQIKQVGIRSDLHNFIRLASSARPPATPIFPNWPWIVGLSMGLCALSSGVYLAWEYGPGVFHRCRRLSSPRLQNAQRQKRAYPGETETTEQLG
jgi:succinoglycan biosynthesis transport protein ExoP